MLALDANPEKVKNASGKVIDLVADGPWNFTKGDPGIQGANGLCYALLMLDAGDYNNPKKPELRKKFITELLEYQKESGGFCIDNSLDPEVDITAMAVQALAPYYKEDKCKKEKLDAQKMKESIDAAVKWLASLESDDAEFLYYNFASSESISQVILALSTYGIDCNKDARFQKKEKGLYDNLMEYYKKDGSFSHLLDGDSDPMATDQAFCAMAAYSRFLNGKTSFFDMSDTNRLIRKRIWISQ